MTINSMISSRKELITGRLILACIVLAKLIAFLFLVDPVYELHRDEFLHLDQGKHLAWGYISVPPVTGWIAGIIHVLGDREWIVRLVPALFGAATICAAWQTCALAGGRLFARIFTASAILCSALLRLNILFQPNSLDALCWTVSYMCLVGYFSTKRRSWLIWLGVSFGIGLLNKYNIVFLGSSLLIGLIVTPGRKLFAEPYLYLAAALAMLIFLPNLLWQLHHGFPVVHHMKELAETQLIHVERTGFLKEQFLYFISSILVWLAGLAALIFYKPFRQYRFISVSFLVCIFIFLYFQAKGYYAMGLYPVLLAFGSIYFERISVTGWKYYLRHLSFLLLIIFFIPALLAFPVMKPKWISTHGEMYKNIGLLRWEDGKDHSLPQDFADMLAWKELASKTDSAYRSLQGKGYTLIRANNYGQAGAINYYAGLNAVSYNADYLNWFHLNQPILNMILIEEAGEDTSKTRERQYFNEVYLFDTLSNPYARELGTRIYILQNAFRPVNPVIARDIEESLKK